MAEDRSQGWPPWHLDLQPLFLHHTMNTLVLEPEISLKLATLYARMEAAYDGVARAMGFSCAGCPDNCCDSYFLHYTYVEWAYLWEGLAGLPEEQQEAVRQRAVRAVAQSRQAIISGGDHAHPMCPLNEQGRCSLYAHRLMICRLHGVPATMTRPDGRSLSFPGCFRCQDLPAGASAQATLDRTDFYQQMVDLEKTLLGPRRGLLPRVKMTLAQMLVAGPPSLS